MAGPPASIRGGLASLAAAFASCQVVVPQPPRMGPLLREALTLLGHAARPSSPPDAPDSSRIPIVAPFAQLGLLGDLATTAGLLAAPEAVLADIRRGRGLVVFDCANEGRALMRPHVANMHAALAAAGIPAHRAAWAQQNRRLEADYHAYCAARGLEPMHLVVAHSHAAGLWRRATLGGRGVNWRFGFALDDSGPRPYRWVCLNYNLRPHRALLVAWLRHRAEPGFLSFSVTRETHGRVAEDRLLDGAAALDRADPDGARRAVADLLASGLHRGSDVDAFDHPNERVYSLPVEAVAAAELFIVTETEMDGRGLLRWTEKTLKAIASGLPVVVFGNAGAVAALTDLGFDMLGDFVDHTYDGEADPAARFAKARDAVARFLSRPPGFTAAEMARLRAAARHNQTVFTEGLPQDALFRPMERILSLAAG